MLSDAVNRRKILTGLLGRKRKSTTELDDVIQSTLSHCNALLPLKKVRSLASMSEYTERRAEECLAAPKNVTFNAVEVVEMLGLSRGGDDLMEKLSSTKTALNAAGAKLPLIQRRMWAKEVTAVLKIMKVVSADMDKLVDKPETADTSSHDVELSHKLVGKIKTVELLSSAIESHLRTLWDAHAARSRQAELEVLATSTVASMRAGVQQKLADASVALTARRRDLADRKGRKEAKDSEIGNLITTSTISPAAERCEDGGTERTNVTGLSACLDVLQSPRPEIVALLRSRQAAHEALSEAEEAVAQAERVLNFRRAMLTLLNASTCELKQRMQVRGDSAARYRSCAIEAASSALAEYIPRLASLDANGTGLSAFARHQRERAAAARRKLATKRNELTEHLKLFGGPRSSWMLVGMGVATAAEGGEGTQDEAPSERREFEAKIREFAGVLRRSSLAIAEMAEKQSQLWRGALVESSAGERRSVPNQVTRVLYKTLRELHDAEKTECEAEGAECEHGHLYAMLQELRADLDRFVVADAQEKAQTMATDDSPMVHDGETLSVEDDGADTEEEDVAEENEMENATENMDKDGDSTTDSSADQEADDDSVRRGLQTAFENTCEDFPVTKAEEPDNGTSEVADTGMVDASCDLGNTAAGYSSDTSCETAASAPLEELAPVASALGTIEEEPCRSSPPPPPPFLPPVVEGGHFEPQHEYEYCFTDEHSRVMQTEHAYPAAATELDYNSDFSDGEECNRSSTASRQKKKPVGDRKYDCVVC